MLFNSPEVIVGEHSFNNAGDLWRSSCIIPGNFLAEGLFSVRATLTTFEKGRQEEVDYPEAITFNVHDSGKVGSVKEKWGSDFPGVVRPKLEWKRVVINKTNHYEKI